MSGKYYLKKQKKKAPKFYLKYKNMYKRKIHGFFSIKLKERENNALMCYFVLKYSQNLF